MGRCEVARGGTRWAPTMLAIGASAWSGARASGYRLIDRAGRCDGARVTRLLYAATLAGRGACARHRSGKWGILHVCTTGGLPGAASLLLGAVWESAAARIVEQPTGVWGHKAFGQALSHVARAPCLCAPLGRAV